MKFLCDDNLGKLAKLLRLLGYDTAYYSTISNGELMAVMLKEDRIVVSRDRHLTEKIEAERLVLVDSDSPEQQLSQVITRLDLRIDRQQFFTRCLVCNEICLEVAKDEIKDRVFPFILKTQQHFRRCPACDRIYWQGSHYKDMVAKLERLIG
jgi:hypothetical protein